jgi:outer membrane protein
MMPLAHIKLGARLAIITWLAAVSSIAFAQDTLQVAASAEDQQFLARAEDLLTSGNAATAYALLSEKESQLAGNPFFDYLLGVAALDSGRAGDAIFSLRRALAIAPGFSGARMELARAYFETGNMALSRPLFVQLLDEQPPPAVRRVIDDYIASIDASPAAPKGSFSMHFDAAAGYDTNANGSTDNQQFLGFMLNPNNVETESSFADVGAAFAWSKPKSTRFSWYSNGRAGLRHNPDADFVDSTVVNGAGGMNWQRGKFFGRAGIDGYWSTRDGDSNQSYAGLDTLFGRRLNQNWDVSVGIRGGALRYDNSIDIMDVNRMMFTGRLGRVFSSGGSFGFELVGGSDSERRSSSPYGNSKLGGRLTLYAPMNANTMLFVSSGSLTSDYDGLFFGSPREDTQISTLLQVEFRNVGRAGLSLTPRLRHIENDSSVALYDYDRLEFSLNLRWTPQ